MLQIYLSTVLYILFLYLGHFCIYVIHQSTVLNYDIYWKNLSIYSSHISPASINLRYLNIASTSSTYLSTVDISPASINLRYLTMASTQSTYLSTRGIHISPASISLLQFPFIYRIHLFLFLFFFGGPESSFCTLLWRPLEASLRQSIVTIVTGDNPARDHRPTRGHRLERCRIRTRDRFTTVWR